MPGSIIVYSYHNTDEGVGMARLLEMSEATALGLHAMVQIAKSEGLVSAESLAKTLRASQAHLSKVLKTLSDEGFLISKRGPSGGYQLAQSATEISLLRIYEALQGSIRLDRCLFDKPICDQVHCFLGDLVEQVRGTVFEHLATTTLAEASES
jgi:Rrf2 family protein